jgi:hypothetical protein
VQQVKNLFVVYLDEAAEYRDFELVPSYLVKQVGDAAGYDATFARRVDVRHARYSHLAFGPELLFLAQKHVDVLRRSLQPSDLFSSIKPPTKHRVSLARACLPVRKNSAVETFEYIVDTICDILENLLLGVFLAKDLIKLRFDMMSHINQRNELSVRAVCMDNYFFANILRQQWPHSNGYIQPLRHKRRRLFNH